MYDLNLCLKTWKNCEYVTCTAKAICLQHISQITNHKWHLRSYYHTSCANAMHRVEGRGTQIRPSFWPFDALVQGLDIRAGAKGTTQENVSFRCKNRKSYKEYIKQSFFSDPSIRIKMALPIVADLLFLLQPIVRNNIVNWRSITAPLSL